MPTAYGYIRVSTADQADHGVSLDAQRDAIDAEFEYRWKPQGYDQGYTFEDRAQSGAKPLRSRKAGDRMCGVLGRGDVVIFTKLDRGFRNVEDILATLRIWNDQGVKAVFLDMNCDTSTASGEMMMTMLAAFAQFERRRIGDRTREGLAQVRRSGKLCTKPPFGVKVTGPKGSRKWEIVPDDYAVGKAIVKWRLEGHGWEAIYGHLRRNGVTRPRLKSDPLRKLSRREWSVTGIRRAYAGTLKIMKWVEEGKLKEPKVTS